MLRVVLMGLAVAMLACENPSAPPQQTVLAPAKLPPPAESATPPGPWPQWRGPQQDGIARETNWRRNWDQHPPQILWKTNVGIGYSSVAVVQGRLYTLGHRDGQEHLWCLDALTGKPLWKDSYPGKLVDYLHKGGPGSTPTVTGKYVLTLGREGQLRCYEASSGKLRWSQELQKLFQVELPDWGFTCSPVVVGSAVVVDAGWIAALDLETGKLLWKTGPFRPGYGTPLAFEDSQGRKLLAVLTNDALVVVRQQDGKLVAKYPWETPYVTSATTPIVHQDHIFISTGYNKGCVLLRLQGDKLVKVYGHNRMANHMNTCILWEGHLYGIHGNSHARRQCRLVCMDWESGQIRWQQRGFGCGAWTLADGMLIILSDDGRLCLVEANPQKFRQLGEVKVLEETCWTVPVLAGGIIYCRNDQGDLVAVDVRPRS